MLQDKRKNNLCYYINAPQNIKGYHKPIAHLELSLQPPNLDRHFGTLLASGCFHVQVAVNILRNANLLSI